MADKLDGLRILVLEDEFLIAMDVEQICRDYGASDVIIARTIEEAEAALDFSRIRCRDLRPDAEPEIDARARRTAE